MAAQLTEFLARYADRPFSWEDGDNCCLFLADWWKERHGSDPAACFRGWHATEAEWRKAIAAQGGALRLVTMLARGAGAIPTKAPVTGDIAVIRSGNMVVGAILSGDFWAVRNQHIGFVRDARVLRAWKA